jgi:ABC-type glycerol-3-phosphate transport system permease component
MVMSPPTPEELETLSIVSVVAFFIATVTTALVIAYLGFLVVRTKLPGRIEALLGALLFAVFSAWSQYMGGYLEMTLGPLGTLLEVTAWSASLALFLFGHFRMFKHFRRKEHENAANN